MRTKKPPPLPEWLPYDESAEFPTSRHIVESSVEFDGGWLVWTGDPSQRDVGFVAPSVGMLEEFVRLAGEPDPAPKVLAFAQRWGQLRLCGHGLPESHTLARDGHVCWEPQPPGPGHRESLESWLFYSRFARALLRIADRLHDLHDARKSGGEPRSDAERRQWLEDWRTVLGFKPSEDLPWWLGSEGEKLPLGPRVWMLWNELETRVDNWLAMGNVRPHLEYKTRSQFLEFVIAGHFLFGALALQLALNFSRSRRLAVCSACGRVYQPKRTPAQNRRRFCPKCRQREAWKAASRDYYLRERAQASKARQLYGQGLSATAIARRLDKPLKKVMRWIGFLRGTPSDGHPQRASKRGQKKARG